MATTSSTGLGSTSLSGLGLPGLSSGIDTTGIITKLMAIESQPQALLKGRLSGMQTHTSALQSLNTAVAGIATTAKAALTANALTSFTARSDSAAAGATAAGTASAGSVSFTVDRLATAQVSVSKAMPALDVSQLGTVTLRTGVAGAYTDTRITLTSGDLDSVVSAINASGAGVSATKVSAGTVDGVPQYRLQLRSTTGAAGAFSFSLGYPYSTDASSTLGLTTISTAQDARITLWPGTAAATERTSATNTIASVLPGVDVTVSATTPSTSPVTVTVAPDPTAATTSAQALTAALVSVFSGIASATAITTSASTSGGTSGSATTGGIFTGDTLVRTLKDALLGAISGQDGTIGASPSTIGITLTKDGTITFDQARFAAAMTADPVGTTAMYKALAGQVAKVADAASAPSSGSISQAIASATTQQSDLSTKISDWDTRLAAIQAQYQLQFNNLEVALNSLSSQASYLTSQINGLTTNYQSR